MSLLCSLSRKTNRKHVMPLAVTAVTTLNCKWTTCTLLNLAVLLHGAECVLVSPCQQVLLYIYPRSTVLTKDNDESSYFVFFKELQTIFAVFCFYLSKLFPMKNVKSFVLLTDHSQPSHAIHLLCIRWWPCEYTSSPAVPPHSMFCILRCFLIPHLIFFFYTFKDTTDYVAYVAKDPVNRRGILPSCAVVSRSLTAF